MNLKLKRVVRTPYSEEIVIFDGDTKDENNQAVNIGKLEVHYLSDQVAGTLLLWQEFAQEYNRTHAPGSEETIDDLIDMILSEVTEPIGLPTEYGIEVYYPSVTNQSFISNYASETDEDAEAEEYDDEEYEDDDSEDDEELEADENDESTPRDDDYYRKLTQRP
jgi:hypothetical protein